MHVTPKRPFFSLLLTALLFVANHQPAFSQSASSSAPSSSSSLPDAPEPQNQSSSAAPVSPLTSVSQLSSANRPEDINLVGMPKRLLRDQEVIWTSPAHLKPKDANLARPLRNHHRDADRKRSAHDDAGDPHQLQRPEQGQQPLTGSTCRRRRHSRRRLSLEPRSTTLRRHTKPDFSPAKRLLNSYAVNDALKAVFRRDRPLVNNASGNFFSSGPLELILPLEPRRPGLVDGRRRRLRISRLAHANRRLWTCQHRQRQPRPRRTALSLRRSRRQRRPAGSSAAMSIAHITTTR